MKGTFVFNFSILAHFPGSYKSSNVATFALKNTQKFDLKRKCAHGVEAIDLKILSIFLSKGRNIRGLITPWEVSQIEKLKTKVPFIWKGRMEKERKNDDEEGHLENSSTSEKKEERVEGGLL